MLNTEYIDNILNKFLEPFEVTASLGTDFCYYYGTNRIEYALVVSERMDNLFMQNAISLGLKENVNMFILSLLHELGHNETLDELDDAECNFSADVKANLSTSDEDCMIYFNLPDEVAATKWAIDFIHNNAEAVKNLWNQVQPAIMNFYAANNIH